MGKARTSSAGFASHSFDSRVGVFLVLEVLALLPDCPYETESFFFISQMNSSDILRAGCSTPRDVTVLYENMLKVGLQYGPSFRLLSQVWVPDDIAAKQNEQAKEETVA